MKKILFVSLLLLMPVTMSAQEKKDCCKKAAKPVVETIMSRTSIRKFKTDTICPEMIETMLRAGMAAPTAMNRQPWHFVVVTNRQKLEEMGGRAKQAPLAIVVCGDFTKTIEGPIGKEFWIQDCSAATENILLAAHSLGLGAVWTSSWPNEERSKNYGKLLGLPDTLMPLCVVAVGFPDESPEPKDKWKPENITFVK